MLCIATLCQILWSYAGHWDLANKNWNEYDIGRCTLACPRKTNNCSAGEYVQENFCMPLENGNNINELLWSFIIVNRKLKYLSNIDHATNVTGSVHDMDILADQSVTQQEAVDDCSPYNQESEYEAENSACITDYTSVTLEDAMLTESVLR